MKKKIEKKEITLETLSEKVDKGFRKMERGFREVHKTIENLTFATKRGFDEVTGRLDDLEAFQHKAEANFFIIDSKLETIDKRLDTIETTITPLVPLTKAMQKELHLHDRRLTAMEK